MSTDIVRPLLRLLIAAALLVFAALVGAPAGAHGPAGDHDHAEPARSGTSSLAALPRFESASDAFELVGTLAGRALSILIDRFETNAPVLNARVEVEAAGRSAEAKFHADGGDYVVDDAALVAALAAPGEHAVVVAIVVGEESDLLSGTLVVPRTGNESSEHAPAAPWPGAGAARIAWLVVAAVLGLLAVLFVARRYRRRALLSTAGGGR